MTVMEREDPAGSNSISDDSRFQSIMSLCKYLHPQRALSSGVVHCVYRSFPRGLEMDGGGRNGR